MLKAVLVVSDGNEITNVIEQQKKVIFVVSGKELG